MNRNKCLCSHVVITYLLQCRKIYSLAYFLYLLAVYDGWVPLGFTNVCLPEVFLAFELRTESIRNLRGSGSI